MPDLKVEVAVSVGSADDLYINPQEEARVVRKLDTSVLPILGLLYFLAALDRSNIGNSATAGLKANIGLSDLQYSNAVSLLFVTYILSEIPATLLLRKFKPHRFLAMCGACWALVTIGTTFVQSYGSLLACRLLLGLFEGGYFPCLMLYVLIFYKQQEQGLRMAVLLLCAGLAGAFGGLISYALVQVETDNRWLQGYRLIYLVEGLITVCAIPLVFFVLPDDELNIRYFNVGEKDIMRARARQRAVYMGSDKFDWHEVKLAYMDPKTWFSMVIQFCQDTVLYGFSTFLPTILKSGLGFNANEAQYLTIPVYIVSVVAVILISYCSDRMGVRGPFIAAANGLGIVGYILLLACSNNAVKYFACSLIAFPLYICPGLNLAWTSNNTFPHFRRATAVGSNQTLGNISGAIAGQIYRKLPYRLGHAFSLGCLVVSTGCVALNTAWLWRLNTVKARIECGDKVNERPRTGDQAVDFKYSL